MVQNRSFYTGLASPKDADTGVAAGEGGLPERIIVSVGFEVNGTSPVDEAHHDQARVLSTRVFCSMTRTTLATCRHSEGASALAEEVSFRKDRNR